MHAIVDTRSGCLVEMTAMPTRATLVRSIGFFLLISFGATLASASETRKAEPFVGVTHYQVIQTAEDKGSPELPRPVVVNILEIDVTAPGVKFEMSPGNGDAPGEITRGTTRKFVDSIGAQIGINVGFYDTKANYGGLNTDLMHLAASKGDVYSPAHGDEWIFDVSPDGKPRIAKADGKDAATAAGVKVHNAAGGNQPMLANGEVVAPPDSGYTKALNPHTAVGVSKDKTKVYLVTVDGRQNGYSEGMRTDEMARLMLQFGAWDAINFDGGGSTTMVIDDTDNKTQDAHLLNSPSDNSSPAKAGSERVVANSLAVFATPKAGYVPLPAVPRPKMEDGLELVKARTVIDNFDADAGHFAGAVVASGSTKGVGEKSSATLDASVKHDGTSSLKIDVVADSSGAESILRLLSGDASPKTNKIDGKAMGNDGFVGLWLRREKSETPLFVSIVVDEGTPSAVATERGQVYEVKADGQWHLYQWGLNEDAKWFNYNGGNGKIDGPNVFVDSFLFRTARNPDEKGVPFNGTIWMDSLTYNPEGHIE